MIETADCGIPCCSKCSGANVVRSQNSETYQCDGCGESYDIDIWEQFLDDCSTPVYIRVHPESGLSFTKLVARVFLSDPKTIDSLCPEIGGLKYSRGAKA